MRRLGLYLFLALALLLVACCGQETTDEAVIEDTIRGYVETFNAGDFTQCLSYFTGYGDEEDALAFLAYIRGLSGPLELREVKDIAIFPVAVPGGSPTATVTVIFTITGEESTDQIRLEKIDDHWKIVWEQ